MARQLQMVVDESGFLHAMHGAAEVVGNLLTPVARALEAELRLEGGAAARRLAAPWEIVGGGDTRDVIAPEWWAHFVAHGTREHGPRTADKLVFQVHGETIFADVVRAVPATDFDRRAVETTQGRLDSIIRAALAEAGA